ncbi:MAG: sigma 54-interacting transcriptional regulator, partial [Pseudomonadota bacterium]|nr:sigma 54-interacting transcriptional regulator [Pseudomonadota bacterium]
VAIVPLSAGGNVLGYLSIGSLKTERNWPENFVRRLMLIGEIFANALLSQQKETELRQTLAESMTIRQRVEAENTAWREEVLHGDDFVEVVGESPQTRALLRQVDQVAQTDSTVLLLGETGTGKGLIARFIHQRSRRAKQPLIRVNCATLPSTLIESELFGHEKGAFTGAVARKLGRFELAHGGTIVLDEIGELPLALQAKLLQVLQTGEFERLGSAETRYTDARIIAATNRDLEKMSLDGTFRQDLYYRLGVFPLTLPPLREHKTDIPLLAAYFVERLRTKLDKQIIRIPDQAIAELLAYSWPGNVRELENIVERSMILSPESHLVVGKLMDAAAKPGKTAIQSETKTASMRTLEEMEREYIRSICKRCGWKVAGNGSAAEILDLHPSTLRSRMKKLGISRPPIG